MEDRVLRPEDTMGIIEELAEAIRVLDTIPWRKLTEKGIIFELQPDSENPYKWTWGENLHDTGHWGYRVFRSSAANEAYRRIADQIAEINQLVGSLPPHDCFVEIRHRLERLLAVQTFRTCTPAEVAEIKSRLQANGSPPTAGDHLFQYASKPRQELQALIEAVEAFQASGKKADSPTPGDNGQAPGSSDARVTKAKGGPGSKRGRKPKSDCQKDARIADAWATNQYKTYAALETALKLAAGEASKAVDRHRHRAKRG